jgi:hypothetical protein
MSKINLESDLLTEKRKSGVVTCFIVSEIIALSLWAYDWPFLGLLCHIFAMLYAFNIYKAEVFYNTKNGNKELIEKWLIYFLLILGWPAIVFAYQGSFYSSVFVISIACFQAFEVEKIAKFDREHNGNVSNEPDIFEKHFHVKTLLISLGIIIYGFLAYQFFSAFSL